MRLATRQPPARRGASTSENSRMPESMPRLPRPALIGGFCPPCTTAFEPWRRLLVRSEPQLEIPHSQPRLPRPAGQRTASVTRSANCLRGAPLGQQMGSTRAPVVTGARLGASTAEGFFRLRRTRPWRIETREAGRQELIAIECRPFRFSPSFIIARGDNRCGSPIPCYTCCVS